MSIAASISDSAAAPAVTPIALIQASQSVWRATNRKRVVKGDSMSGHAAVPLQVSSKPDWPGAGEVDTVSAGIPTVVIPGMPAEQYPRYARALVGYTLAELALSQPCLAPTLWSRDMIHMAALVVSTRCGVWASLGQTPLASETVSSVALRWSARNGAVVVRQGETGDGTELWRYFLASCPGLPPVLSEVCPALVGLAPMQFIMGSALLLQSGEVYAMHYLETAIRSHLRAGLSSDALRFLRLDHRATWDTLSAAAIGGYRASVIKSLSNDPVFTLGAHLRMAGADAVAIQSRLNATLASAGVTHRGISAAPASSARRRVEPTLEDADDCASVADTEDGGDMYDLPSVAGSGAATPRAEDPPVLGDAERDAIISAMRAVPRMTQPAASLARGMVGRDSVVF